MSPRAPESNYDGGEFASDPPITFTMNPLSENSLQHMVNEVTAPDKKLVDETLSSRQAAEMLSKNPEELRRFNVDVIKEVLALRLEIEQMFASGDTPFDEKTGDEINFRAAMRNFEKTTRLNTMQDWQHAGTDEQRIAAIKRLSFRNLPSDTDTWEPAKRNAFGKAIEARVMDYEDMSLLCIRIAETTEDMLISNVVPLNKRFNTSLDSDHLMDLATSLQTRIQLVQNAAEVYAELQDRQYEVGRQVQSVGLGSIHRTLSLDEAERLYKGGTPNRGGNVGDD